MKKSSSSEFKDILSNALTALNNVKENKKKLENVFPENYFAKDKYNIDILKKSYFYLKLSSNWKRWWRCLRLYLWIFLKTIRFSIREEKSGEFYTPKSLVDLLVNLLKLTSGKIYDPCFGSGGMFFHALNYIKEKNFTQNLKNTMFIG